MRYSGRASKDSCPALLLLLLLLLPASAAARLSF
jgi:hypothetical protein